MPHVPSIVVMRGREESYASKQQRASLDELSRQYLNSICSTIYDCLLLQFLFVSFAFIKLMFNKVPVEPPKIVEQNGVFGVYGSTV